MFSFSICLLTNLSVRIKYAYIINTLSTLCAKEKIMKSFKFIPALAIVALLSACGTSKSVSVKAPKTMSKGQEISVQTFIEDGQKALDALEVLKDDVKFGSKAVTVKASEEETQTANRDGKTYASSRTAGVEELDFKADSKTYVLKGQMNFKRETSMKDLYYETKSYDVSKQTAYMQEVEKDGNKYYGSVNTTTEEVITMFPLSDTLTLEDAYNTMVGNMISSYANLNTAKSFIAMATTLSEEELAHYKFYENKNVFTVVYQLEETDDYKDASDEVVYSAKTTYSTTYQFKLDDKDLRTITLKEEEKVKTFVKDYDDAFAGDVVTEIENEYLDFQAKDAKVSLKSVSYDGYHFVTGLI